MASKKNSLTLFVEAATELVKELTLTVKSINETTSVLKSLQQNQNLVADAKTNNGSDPNSDLLKKLLGGDRK